MKQLATGLGGAIGSRYLKNHNQLVFTEYNGSISKVDLSPSGAIVLSQGTVLLKGTWSLDCETGNQANTSAPSDIFWEQVDPVKRKMTPLGTSQIVNLGPVNYAAITPALLAGYNYTSTPINGSNDATNKLVANDVFCVRTREGNYCKLLVLAYGYDIKLQWTTYKLNPAYAKLGTGYSNPEDIAVLSNEQTAYVTERAGNLVRVNLTNANRAVSAVVASGMTAPQQLWVDEAHNQAYVVEYAAKGKLYRIDLGTGTKTVVYSGLNMAVGLTLSSDLAAAYVTEQGSNSLSRITLGTGVKTTIATGLTSPFFLTWSDSTETRLLVAERDPANRISMVDVSRTSANVSSFITGTAVRPSSIAVIQPGTYCVCCEAEVDEHFLTLNVATGLYKGIGYVPWNLINAAGKADTTTQPAYPFQFPKDSPFGGTLPVLIDHQAAWDSGAFYYRVMVDGVPRLDVWSDLRLNPANGKYEIIEQMQPDASGFYKVHNPINRYYNADLGCLLVSTNLSNSLHASFTVEFYNTAHAVISTKTHKLHIDNNQCVASMDMPVLDGTSAQPQCGYLKYTDKTHLVTLHYMASHPMGFANYSFSIIKGAFGHYSVGGPLVPNPFIQNYTESVNSLLGTCPTVAAFAESLYVATTVINGVGRQSQYDASASLAFCLAP